jgi:NAD(P)-dependent dehydrogenase (short-subunit alcohol dehydrogenase family)
MTGKFSGKVALVTGAGSGIGRASALLLAQNGAKVVVGDRDAESARDTAERIVAAGGEAVGITMDVTSAAEVRAAVDCAVNTFGRLDLAHNNAGVLVTTSLEADDAEEALDLAFAVNAKGVMLSMKYEIEAMLRTGGGSIVNTASTQGLVASPQWAYTASKHACVGLTRAIAIAYAQRGIRVNAVCPGAVLTGMTMGMVEDHPEAAAAAAAMHPLGRFAQPEEIASIVACLLSDESSYMTGTAVPIDGGYTAL